MLSLTVLSLTVLSLVFWILLLLVPWRSWLNGEILEKAVIKEDSSFPFSTGVLNDIAVLIPARNEAEYIAGTLESVISQSVNLEIVVVDDGSTDGTGDIVRKEFPQVTLISCPDRPQGWSGKLWALHNGLSVITRPKLLLLDADIQLHPGVLVSLNLLMTKQKLNLVSIMARLRNKTLWERLLIPAFVFFFKQIYPFRLSNSSFKKIAAAAGGCILVETAALRSTGGFEKIGHAIIDDCSLARQIKSAGYRTWIGLSELVTSERKYEKLSEIWTMIDRTAFTQLNHSVIWLMVCTAMLVICFWFPLLGLFDMESYLYSLVAISCMSVTYSPTLIFYRQSLLWSLTMPVIGSLYLMMTWSSAFKYWTGYGAVWKGRAYQ